MLKYIALMIFLIPVLAFGQPEFKFTTKSHKFKKTVEGPLLTFTYPFTNTGNAPLVITQIKRIPNCSCTKFYYPEHPVLPNQTDTITVTFDTNKKIGYQNRELEIHSNALKGPHTIRFKGVVKPIH